MFISPLQIIENLGLKRGDVVADFGCGAGAYVFPVSKIVGDKGKVYAVDIHKEILEKISHEADKKQIINIDPILADIEEIIPIESYSCDLIILSNILSEIIDTEKVLSQVKRILKPDGLLLVADWKDLDHPISTFRNKIISEDGVVNILQKNNFYIKKHFPAGNYHYAFLALEK